MDSLTNKSLLAHQALSEEIPASLTGVAPDKGKVRRMFSTGSGGVCVVTEAQYPPDSIITSDVPGGSN